MSDPLAPGTSMSGAGARILVVEDEALIAEEIQDRLKRMQYQVSGVVDTAAKALQLAAEAQPDLVLMDIRLKGPMDGIEAASLIYTRFGIPSVFVTAHSDADTIERAGHAGQFGYVLKPLEEGALQAAIEMARQRHRLERDLQNSQITQATMVHCASDAIIGEDLNGVILSWNPAAEALFGYTAREAIGQNAAFLTPAGRKQESAAILERVRAGDPAELAATERRGKDGALVNVWIRISPIRDARGNLIGSVKIVRDLTERLAAERLERELRAIQARQAAMIQYASDAIIGLDLHGVILSWNPAAEKVYGYSPGEAIGRSCTMLAPDARRAEVERALERVGRGEAFNLPATERRHKDGSLVELSISAAPVRDFAGNVAGAVVIARDISEQMRSDRKLRESQAHLLASQRIGQVGSWEVSITSLEDLAVAPLQWSDESFRIFGYEPRSGPISSALFWERVHPDDRDKVAAALPEALRSGSVYEIEHRILLSDGAERVVHERAEIVTDPQTGQPLKFIGTIQDVTERNRAEDTLRESEKRLRAIVEGMPVLLIAFDENSVPTTWNHECERVTGYRAAEIVGNPNASELLYPDPQERARMLECFRARGGSTRGQLWSLTAKDGTVKTVEWSSNSDQLAIPGWAAWSIGVDVTRRLKLEEQLRQSQKLEGLGRLAGGVAHDFNNLLAVINGYCELILRRTPEGAPARPSLMQIRSAGQKAADLTRQLLAFGRHQSIQLQPLDLNVLLQENQPILRSVVGDDIELVTGLDADLSWVMADPGQFHQVLMNLVVNARDAMPGGGQIVIRTARLEVGRDSAEFPAAAAPGSYVVLSVSDTGAGIAPDIMDRIFDPFFTTKCGEAGTGLGLAIVYAAVKQAGGAVLVYSKPGAGTTFSVLLPRTEIRESASKPAVPARQEEEGGETILVVEDRADVRGVVASSLNEFGYRILEAGSGEEALRQAQGYPGRIHLMLTDVVMPGMTGVELAASMKSVRPEIKALFMSGYASNLTAEEDLLDSGTSWIPKPFGPDELATKVREVLGRPAA